MLIYKDVPIYNHRFIRGKECLYIKTEGVLSSINHYQCIIMPKHQTHVQYIKEGTAHFIYADNFLIT